jgi:hypothetical protein
MVIISFFVIINLLEILTLSKLVSIVLEKFCHLATNKRALPNLQRMFWDLYYKIHHVLREICQKLPHLNIPFMEVVNTKPF